MLSILRSFLPSSQRRPRHLSPLPAGATILGLLWLTACTPMEPPPDEPRPDAAAASVEVDPAAPKVCQDPAAQWSYEGATGPDHWADLSRCFGLCGAGDEQSPIDLQPVSPSPLPQLTFSYGSAPLRLHNNGHTIVVLHDSGSTLDFAEMSFRLRQLHFHAPSEHTRQGVASPLEMHLVHSSTGGSLAVVAVFIEPGDDNAALAAIWPHLPKDPGDPFEVPEVTVDTPALLPQSQASYRYAGSLTTPPCGEEVRWIVLAEAITLSREKIDAFTALYDGNRRPIQPLGARQVVSDL